MTPECRISKHVYGECDHCKTWTERLHMPEEMNGWYCSQCCPVCLNKEAQKSPARAA